MDSRERAFDRSLGELKTRLLHMAAVAETMINRAIGQLVTRDERVAEPVPRYEEEINRMQVEIDEAVVTLIATQQPVAADLRFVLAVSRINNELERIGDKAVSITKSVRVLARLSPAASLFEVPQMADLTRKLVRNSLEAFVRQDVLLAQSVISSDDSVDELKDRILRELLGRMVADPQSIESGLALMSITRYLERIADLAVNIAENVIYLIQGRDVRHLEPLRNPDLP